LNELISGVKRSFGELFGGDPEVAVRAPGRVNLIGEHTDYNDGFVMPVAIDRFIAMAASKSEGEEVELHSLDYAASVRFPLSHIEYDHQHLWSNYFKGVAYLLRQEGYEIGGCRVVLKGDIPQGAGLSSSAALEVASALTLKSLFALPLADKQLIRLCQRAENEFVGVRCGIMDQFVSCLARLGSALFLDCRELSYGHIPFSDEFRVMVCNTMVRRELASSQYNIRRGECEEGVRILAQKLPGIKALRDVSLDEFLQHRHLLPPLVSKRCRHVIKENQRVLEGTEMLKRGDMHGFGRLMHLSHYSLKEDYEVSCPELDCMVELAESTEGVVGARMTGAGFGGCTVNIVHRDKAEEAQKSISSRYNKEMGVEPEIYLTSPAEGALEGVFCR